MESGTLTINKFLGLNKALSDTELQPGESPSMKNMMITNDYKLKKMFGYAKLFNTLGTHKINGIWYGTLGSTAFLVFSCNGHLYNSVSGTNTDLGTIADTHTMLWSYNNTLYIYDGTSIYTWGGTSIISAIVGYVPTVAVACVPSGGGTLFEGINMLSGYKKQKFSANGTATVYQLLETNITSVTTVKVNGTTLNTPADYTLSTTNGTVTFSTAPTTGTDNVEITWLKANTSYFNEIANCKYFGGVYGTSIWLYGNPNHKTTRYRTGVSTAGIIDPTYFVLYTSSDVSENEITGMVTQYDKLLTFTNDSAWYSTIYQDLNADSGIVITDYLTYPLNSRIGNHAKGQVQLINNNPITIHNGIRNWASVTSVADEKNENLISQRVQTDLNAVDLSTAITIDWNEKMQYWVCVGTSIWIYNYLADVWYYIELLSAPDCFCVVDGKMTFGSGGTLYQFDEDLLTYDETEFTATWDSSFLNFGTDYQIKALPMCYVSLGTSASSKIGMTFEHENGTTSRLFEILNTKGSVDFDDFDFNNVHFGDMSNIEPFVLKTRAKKFVYLKLHIISNYSTYNSEIETIIFPFMIGGKIRGGS